VERAAVRRGPCKHATPNRALCCALPCTWQSTLSPMVCEGRAGQVSQRRSAGRKALVKVGQRATARPQGLPTPPADGRGLRGSSLLRGRWGRRLAGVGGRPRPTHGPALSNQRVGSVSQTWSRVRTPRPHGRCLCCLGAPGGRDARVERAPALLGRSAGRGQADDTRSSVVARPGHARCGSLSSAAPAAG
jgi:hypothetical protein